MKNKAHHKGRMTRLVFAMAILIIGLPPVISGQANSSSLAVKRTATLMGSKFDITIVAKDSVTAEALIDTAIEEISRIESLISEWKSNSEVSMVNRNAGIKPVKVSKELFDLTKRALNYSLMSRGAFDISFASLNKIWRFDGSMTTIPSKEEVLKSIEKVGFQHIILDSLESTIYLQLLGMKIGFGSIGKGYAADKAMELMRRKGVKAGIINAAGDMQTWGVQPNGKQWTVGLTNPFKKRKIIKKLNLRDMAITTSGSYEHFIELNGVRYSHIINPVTGYPVTGLASVTILGPNAEICNAISTSVMVMGLKQGLSLIGQFPGYQYVIITDKGKMYKNKGQHF